MLIVELLISFCLTPDWSISEGHRSVLLLAEEGCGCVMSLGGIAADLFVRVLSSAMLQLATRWCLQLACT